MSNTKTGLLYSDLTSRVYCGTMNSKTGIARGNKKDVTSDFIGIMLKKFPVGHRQNIVCNGELEAVIYVVDEKTSHRLNASKEMYEMLEDAADMLFQSGEAEFRARGMEIRELLAKARGES